MFWSFECTKGVAFSCSYSMEFLHFSNKAFKADNVFQENSSFLASGLNGNIIHASLTATKCDRELFGGKHFSPCGWGEQTTQLTIDSPVLFLWFLCSVRKAETERSCPSVCLSVCLFVLPATLSHYQLEQFPGIWLCLLHRAAPRSRGSFR